MGSKKSLIWVLADDRPGNYSQAIGLAESLNRPFKIKKIVYNSWAKLPNFLKLNGLIGVCEASKNKILNQEEPPQIIISAGRKTSLIALYLKNHYKIALSGRDTLFTILSLENFKPFRVLYSLSQRFSCGKGLFIAELNNMAESDNIFLINIMNPQSNFDKFDLVIVPKHDNIKPRKNLITSIGSLNRIDNDVFKAESKKFPDLRNLKSPKIALFIGGSSKKGRFNSKISKELAKISSKFTENINGNLLIVTSRRTDQIIIDELENNLKCDYKLFKYKPNQPSPYLAILHICDYVIVTGDSMSMCSEACSSGKPVYIYNPDKICSKKHLELHKNLFENNYANKLDANINISDYKSKKILKETKRISAQINQLLSYRRQ